MAKQTKARRALLARLETMIGSECYNGNIQNYGPGGVWEGQGRKFKYPLSYTVGSSGEFDLRKQLMTGHYVFGANKLHIMRALDNVLTYLEEKHGLKIDRD